MPEQTLGSYDITIYHCVDLSSQFQAPMPNYSFVYSLHYLHPLSNSDQLPHRKKNLKFPHKRLDTCIEMYSNVTAMMYYLTTLDDSVVAS